MLIYHKRIECANCIYFVPNFVAPYCTKIQRNVIGTPLCLEMSKIITSDHTKLERRRILY